MDCIITIKGGAGRGTLVKAKTGPVRDFVRDLDIYYDAVYNHCKTCQVCNPNEILRGFLSNRDTLKKKGKTTNLLVNMALRYERNVPKTDPVLISEFILRSQDQLTILKHAKRFSEEQILQAMRSIHEKFPSNEIGLPFDSIIRAIETRNQFPNLSGDKSAWMLAVANSFNATGFPETDEEALKVASVAYVLSS